MSGRLLRSPRKSRAGNWMKRQRVRAVTVDDRPGVQGAKDDDLPVGAFVADLEGSLEEQDDEGARVAFFPKDRPGFEVGLDAQARDLRKERLELPLRHGVLLLWTCPREGCDRP
jgi:hypothetical protein